MEGFYPPIRLWPIWVVSKYCVLLPVAHILLISLFLNSVPLSIRTFSDSSKLTINLVNVGSNNIFCTFSLKWYAKYKSGMHADHCQSISISFRRWWVKFTNQVHRYELHWGRRGLKNGVCNT